MEFLPTRIPDVVRVRPRLFGDERGFFMETWQKRKFSEAGIDADFVQDNHSRSAQGVLRGIHYQLGRPQGKLVRVVSGRVFDVAVDLRRSSPTFAQWVGVELSEQNAEMLWVPPGFGHAFLVLSETADFVYKCTEFYSPADERTLIWNDPEVGIEWPLGLPGEPVLSTKDSAGLTLRDAELYK